MDKEKYFKLFSSTFVLSAFTVGGGYVIVPLMQKRFVEELKWISKEEMLDLVAIAQSSPGVMAVNVSIILGKKLAGFKGSLVAVLGTILPPFITLSIISLFYEWFKNDLIVANMLQGMQAGIAAIVISSAIKMLIELKDDQAIYNYLLCFIAFVLAFIFKVNVIYLIISAIVLALITFFAKKEKKL